MLFYFRKCCHWCVDTSNVFKNVDLVVDVDYKPSVPVEQDPNVQIGKGNSTADPDLDWTELNDMPSPKSGKNPSYQRSGSKDCMEVILCFL